MNAPAPLSGLSIRTADLADPGEFARIDGFVRSTPGSSIFHRPQWSRAVELGSGQRAHYLVAECGGAITGCLPLSEIRSRLFGNAMVSTGFGTGGGVLAESVETRESLAEAAWALTLGRGCTGLELRGGELPGGWEPRSGVYANFSRELSADADALLAAIPRRQRADVRKARAHGLEVSFGADERHRAAHYRVYAESVRNLGTPVYPRSLFDAALDQLGAEAEVMLVSLGGRPLSSMLCFLADDTIQPYWGGGTGDARRWHANDLAYFAMMCRGIERGCSYADFGRSKVGTGPWARKRFWGFDEQPLVYGLRTIDGRQAREINPQNARFRLKVAAWQRLPLPIANRLGPIIARGLG